MESNLTFTLIFCSALCAIITFSTSGKECGLTWKGGMGWGKFYVTFVCRVIVRLFLVILCVVL